MFQFDWKTNNSYSYEKLPESKNRSKGDDFCTLNVDILTCSGLLDKPSFHQTVLNQVKMEEEINVSRPAIRYFTDVIVIWENSR